MSKKCKGMLHQFQVWIIDCLSKNITSLTICVSLVKDLLSLTWSTKIIFKGDRNVVAIALSDRMRY